MATSELLQLIDLSLGGEPPCGVVNFNNMHILLHEIVRRLLQLEGFVISNSTAVPTEGGATYIYQPHGGSAAEPIVKMSKSNSVSPAKQPSIAVGTSKQADTAVAASKRVDSSTQVAADGKPKTADAEAATVADDTPQKGLVTSSKREIVSQDGADSRSAAGVAGSGIAKGEETTADTTADKKQSSPVVQDVATATIHDVATVTTQDVATAITQNAATVTTQDVATATSKVAAPEETKELGPQISGDVAVAAGQISPIGSSLSGHMSMRHPSAASSVGATYHMPTSRSRPHMITASNDLAAMERKITELENRLGTVEALPDLLERKGANTLATPVKDLWNFTSLTKRVDAAEDGIRQVS